jgi:N-methylhydantoinase A
MVIIGVDTGGTFTDFVFCEGGKIRTLKLPSTPDNPAKTIEEGIRPYLKQKFILLHGTTVATNAFLEKRMARTGFLTTRGFEHILFIGRQNRVEVFSLYAPKAEPIVPLSHCRGISERTLSDGTIRQKISLSESRDVAGWLKKKNIQSVGLVLLHSYRYPGNERQLGDFLRKKGFMVSLSSEILPEYREYERAVVTVLNAALMPVIQRYIRRLHSSVGKNRLYIMQSNGGLLSPGEIVQEPVRTLLSGPSGGVIAGREIARNQNIRNIITLDMGGTSTDVSVIKDGNISLSKNATMAHLPLRLPMIDIETVGAGGGSIARVDSAGVLRVGPESAGADPGPACYGRSMLPTVTDAFVVTGAVRPEYFLGGEMEINPHRSMEAISRLAAAIGADPPATAAGIIRISVSNIERALRTITVEKGEDPRGFSLMPFGGAGGLVSCELADRLGIRQIIAPDYQGVFSALGMLFADYKKEFIRSILKPYIPSTLSLIETQFSSLEKSAVSLLTREGFTPDQQRIKRTLDLRYRGQSYELNVPFTADFIRRFHQLHQQLYSYRMEDRHCEVVNIRVAAIGKIALEHPVPQNDTSRHSPPPLMHPVYIRNRAVPHHFYQKSQLKAGQILNTPAVVSSRYSSLLIDNRFSARVDPFHNILLQGGAGG